MQLDLVYFIQTYLLLFLCFGQDDFTTFRGFICQRGSDEIDCAEGKVLSIVSAKYEGKDFRCGLRNISLLNCSLDVTSAIQDRCQCETQCFIEVRQRSFVNSCPGRNKYVELAYNCLPPTVCQSSSKVSSTTLNATKTTPRSEFFTSPVTVINTSSPSNLSNNRPISYQQATSPNFNSSPPSIANNVLIALAVALVVITLGTIFALWWFCFRRGFRCGSAKLVIPEEHIYDVAVAEQKPLKENDLFRFQTHTEFNNNSRRRLVDDPLPDTQDSLLKSGRQPDLISQVSTVLMNDQTMHNDGFKVTEDQGFTQTDADDDVEAKMVYNELYIPKEIAEQTQFTYSQLNITEYTFANDENDPEYNELSLKN